MNTDEPHGYSSDVAKSRRLASLRVLRENEGSANESLLRVALHQLGFRGRQASDDELRIDADVLAGAGLVTIEYYRGSVRTLTLTKSGLAFLERRGQPVPGIQYPDVA